MPVDVDKHITFDVGRYFIARNVISTNSEIEMISKEFFLLAKKLVPDKDN